MLRLKTPEYLRIVQSQSFEASYGGAEANVAAGLAMLKDEAAFVTKLPDNPVGQSALNELRCYGVDTSDILRGGKRLGIYYFEKGTNIRPTNVVYDREDSAFACSKADEYDWNKILADADVFFFSGVTPAVSETVKESVLMALQFCKEHGIEVVCDLNYRAKMWDKGTAQKVMRELMPYVTICIEAVGAGDAFAAAFIHMLLKKEQPQRTIDFSIAASILKLMIQHDFNIVSEADILHVMKSNDVNLHR